jgi:hypothetical protein
MQFESVYSENWNKINRLAYGSEAVSKRAKFVRIGAAVASLALLSALDASNRSFDTCFYTIDGTGSGALEVASSLDFADSLSQSLEKFTDHSCPALLE